MAGKFSDLLGMLGKLADVPSQIAKDASVGIADAIDAEFSAGLAPDGTPWTGLAESTMARGRSAPPLTDTHDMRDSVDVKPMRGAGISVTIDDPAVHHQYGAPRAHVPPRPILPSGKLPDTWQRAIADAADSAFDRAAGGLRG